MIGLVLIISKPHPSLIQSLNVRRVDLGGGSVRLWKPRFLVARGNVLLRHVHWFLPVSVEVGLFFLKIRSLIIERHSRLRNLLLNFLLQSFI